MNLLKKDAKWEWTEACQHTFDQLKEMLTIEHVLRFPMFDKPFEVHVDASDQAIGGVLVHDKHPIAYESKKIKYVEYRYYTNEKEMTAVIHCFEV